MTAPAAALAASLAEFGSPVLGLAVSGGGDSIALLRLAADWAAGRGTRLAVVTVDHGLRPQAASEADFVARTCADLGLPHDTLHWQGWDGAGNLQDRARAARYGLIAQWAAARGIGQVALAHTLEDQAETVLMRLARASGVDGVSAMGDRQVGGVRFVRPLLGVTRAALREVLTALGQGWVEDPSNDDTRYDRVKMRQQLALLAPLGLDAQALTQVAANMAQAREALNWAAQGFARQHLHMQGPDVMLNAAAFGKLPQELQRRLLVHVLRWLSGAEYAPRRQAVTAFLAAALAGQRGTLHGCVMTHRKGCIYLHREYAAVADLTCDPAAAWDGRWRLTSPAQSGLAQPGLRIAALGRAGLDHLPDWRASGRPAAAVMADPGVWQAQRLIAAPLSGQANGWGAEPAEGRTDCHSALLSH